MPIQVTTGRSGWLQLKAAAGKNWRFYLQEAFGLYIFMVSACFFGTKLFAPGSAWVHSIPDETMRNVIMGIAMGLTALFIFYSPWTAPSGSQINPAVTLSFLRLGKMCRYDAFFYVVAQFIGGTIAVYMMQYLMGNMMTDAPVNSVVTVPGKYGMKWAIAAEGLIAFTTMTMVLFSSSGEKLKKYTRIFSACLVCCWVIFAGPVSGFGMNPARSFASALPAHTWTAFWIYLAAPLTGMLSAAEFFLLIKKKKWRANIRVVHRQYDVTKNGHEKQNETELKIVGG